MEHEFEQEFRMLGLKIAYYRKANNLTQEQLSKTLMPVGQYTKDEIFTSYFVN